MFLRASSAQPAKARMSLFRAHWFALLIRLDWVRRSIRPPARGNHEFVDRFRIAPELWVQHHGHIYTPNAAGRERGARLACPLVEGRNVLRSFPLGVAWSNHAGFARAIFFA